MSMANERKWIVVGQGIVAHLLKVTTSLRIAATCALAGRTLPIPVIAIREHMVMKKRRHRDYLLISTLGCCSLTPES